MKIHKKTFVWHVSNPVSVLHRGICGACGQSPSTPRPAAPASWRYDATRDKRPARGGLRILYLKFEGRREGALTVRPCRHHSFMLSANLLWKPSEGHQCVDHKRPNTTHLWSLHPPPPPLFHLRFRFSVYFLFIIAHPAYAVFTLPPHPHPAPSLLPPSIVATSLPFVGPLLFAFSFIFSASLFVTNSDELEGHASPPILWT